MNYLIWLMLGLGCDGVKESESESTSGEAQIEQTRSEVETQDVSAKKTKPQRMMAQLKPRVFDHVDSVALGLSQQSTGESHVYSMGLMELGLREPAMFSRLPDVSTYVMKHFQVPDTTDMQSRTGQNLPVIEASKSGDKLLFGDQMLLGVVNVADTQPLMTYASISTIHHSQFSSDGKSLLVVEDDVIQALPIPDSLDQSDKETVVFQSGLGGAIETLKLLSDGQSLLAHASNGEVVLMHAHALGGQNPEVLMKDVEGILLYPNKDWVLIVKDAASGKKIELFDVNTKKTASQFEVDALHVGLMRPPHLLFYTKGSKISIFDTSTQKSVFDAHLDDDITSVVSHPKEPMLLIKTTKQYALLDLKTESYASLPENIFSANFDTRGNIHFTSFTSAYEDDEIIIRTMEYLLSKDWLDSSEDRSMFEALFGYYGYNYYIEHLFQGTYNTATKEVVQNKVQKTEEVKKIWNGIVFKETQDGKPTYGMVLGHETNWISLKVNLDVQSQNRTGRIFSTTIYTVEGAIRQRWHANTQLGVMSRLEGFSKSTKFALMPLGEVLYFGSTECGWIDLDTDRHPLQCEYLRPITEQSFAQVNQGVMNIIDIKTGETRSTLTLPSPLELTLFSSQGSSVALRTTDSFWIFPDLMDPTNRVECSSDISSCTVGVWLDNDLPFSALINPISNYRPYYYQQQLEIPIFSTKDEDFRKQNLETLYKTKNFLVDRQQALNLDDIDGRFNSRQHMGVYDTTGRWIRYTRKDGFVEYHLPTGRRMLGVNVKYPISGDGRFETVEEWLLNSLRSSQKRICPNSYVVVELDTSDIEYSSLSAFVSDDLLDTYCQYP